MSRLLWADRYAPATISDLTIHRSLNSRLQALAQSEEIPHLLFTGPPGSGKKARVGALLHAIYGQGTQKVKPEVKTLQKNTRQIELAILGSRFHVEISAGDIKDTDDRFVIQSLVKEIAESKLFDTDGRHTYKVIILSGADSLSTGAQHALRRTMETYMAQTRMILTCQSSSRLIAPLRSRCLTIRVPGPSELEIAQVLKQVASQERWQPSKAVLEDVARRSKRNLRRALLSFQTVHTLCGGSATATAANVQESMCDWEVVCRSLARQLATEQSEKALREARTLLYILLVHCIPAKTVLRTVALELASSFQERLAAKIIMLASHYDASLEQGSKAVFHLEAFVAKALYVIARDHANMPVKTREMLGSSPMLESCAVAIC